VADIVAAALRLLRERGIERCTMAALAVEAGLTPPSLYRYFPDAAAVIRAAAEETLDGMHAFLVHNLSSVESGQAARDALRHTLRGYHQAFIDDRALRELWAGTFASAELVSLNIADSRRNGKVIARLVAPWSALGDADLAARAFLLAHLTGASIALLLETEPDEAAELLRQVEALVDTLFG
jgi:AcrR family transcriptional regulator